MQILNKYSVIEEISRNEIFCMPYILEISKPDISSMQVIVQYTVLEDKTLSQNNSRGTINSCHGLTEIRSDSAVTKIGKYKKEKICNLSFPLANECSIFETFVLTLS